MTQKNQKQNPFGKREIHDSSLILLPTKENAINKSHQKMFILFTTYLLDIQHVTVSVNQQLNGNKKFLEFISEKNKINFRLVMDKSKSKSDCVIIPEM